MVVHACSPSVSQEWQENQKFRVNLSCRVRLPARATRDPVKRKKKYHVLLVKINFFPKESCSEPFKISKLGGVQ